jgi:hypothetical protein
MCILLEPRLSNPVCQPMRAEWLSGGLRRADEEERRGSGGGRRIQGVNQCMPLPFRECMESRSKQLICMDMVWGGRRIQGVNQCMS